MEYPIDSQQIVVIPSDQKKFKVVWTYEAAQDLRAYHNTEAEAELAEILTKELQADMDREILEDLKSAVQKGQETEQKVISGKIKRNKVKVTWNSLFND